MKVHERLDELRLETSSLSFRRGRSRLAEFSSSSDPVEARDRLRLAGQLHRLTGRCGRVSVHFPADAKDKKRLEVLAQAVRDNGLTVSAAYPDLLMPRPGSHLDHRLAFGSLTSPYSDVRVASINFVDTCLGMMRVLKCRQIVLCVPDGADSPGEKNLVDMLDRILNGLRQVSFKLRKSESLLLEYRPFDPSFYASAVPDWGTASWLCRETDPLFRVSLDLESLLPGSSFESSLVTAVRSGMAGRVRLADSVLMGGGLPAGSINSDTLFRVFLCCLQLERAGHMKLSGMPFSVAVNAMVGDVLEVNLQAVENVELALARALLVDLEELEKAQNKPDPAMASRIMRDAFMTDVRPIVRRYRETKGLPPDPLEAYRSGQAQA
ncbi:hypothetical protein JW921_09515 [Candidatus Fermentibacterales bacterium]|nr:hypothetical protein [Candidatus Fermentibacterales bacterium]